MATATAAALFGMECVVYMGEVDTQRQELNVFRMELLGAEVRPVSSGSRTLKDAVNEALRDWVASVDDTHYCLGSVMGPHPYPWMVREFQRVIGDEAREQCRGAARRRRPRRGGGLCRWRIRTPPASSPASPTPPSSALVAVEAAGGAAMTTGIPGVLHGMRSALMQDEEGQILEAHSISAGLDYPGIGPEHAHLGGRGPGPLRVGRRRAGARGLPAPGPDRGHHPRPRVGPRHGLGDRPGRDPDLPSGSTVLVNLSGRGDKDVAQVRELLRP